MWQQLFSWFQTGKHTFYLTKNSLLDGRSSPECYPIKYIVQQVGKRLKAVKSGKDPKGWEKVPWKLIESDAKVKVKEVVILLMLGGLWKCCELRIVETSRIHTLDLYSTMQNPDEGEGTPSKQPLAMNAAILYTYTQW